jgi:hypothetical protein
LAFHNWWHLALFHLEQEDYAAALKLYDDEIDASESDISQELVDASALLWRITLGGHDVGDRWQKTAAAWASKVGVEGGYYAFNDLHAIMAFVGADKLDEARAVLAALTVAVTDNPGVTGIMAQAVGVPACSAMIAFAEQRYDDAVDNLYPIRLIAHRFGGSHAQRDVLTQTLIESAIRAGQLSLASNLLHERSIHKPTSPLTVRFKQKLISASQSA